MGFHPLDQLNKENVASWRNLFYGRLKELVGNTRPIDGKKYTLNYCLFEYEGKQYHKAAIMEAEKHYGISQD